MDRRGGEEYETEDGAKKLIVKGAYFCIFISLLGTQTKSFMLVLQA